MKILLAIAMFLLLTAPAYAQEPTPAPGGGQIVITPEVIPFTFAPYTYTTSGHLDQLDIFNNPSFINPMGSTTLTIFSILDSQDVLVIFVVLLIALSLLWRVYKFTTTARPDSTDIDLSMPDLSPPYVENTGLGIQ